MTKIILRYGLIGGAIVSLLMGGTILMMRMHMDNMGIGSMLYGYATMVLAFSSIYFAINSYRKQNGGVVGFGQSLAIGLGISIIASTFYVATWMLYVNTSGKGFEAKYAAAYQAKAEKDSTAVINKMIADGKPAAEIDKKQHAITAEREKNAQMMEMYANNNFVKAGFTYMEILPVGILMSLIIATVFVFKKK